MKLYEKIYLPERQEGARAFRDNQGDVPVVMHGPVIVLNIQDLQDLWNAAKDRACALQMGHPGDTKIFEAYLESKGINIITNEK